MYLRDYRRIQIGCKRMKDDRCATFTTLQQCQIRQSLMVSYQLTLRSWSLVHGSTHRYSPTIFSPECVTSFISF